MVLFSQAFPRSGSHLLCCLSFTPHHQHIVFWAYSTACQITCIHKHRIACFLKCCKLATVRAKFCLCFQYCQANVLSLQLSRESLRENLRTRKALSDKWVFDGVGDYHHGLRAAFQDWPAVLWGWKQKWMHCVKPGAMWCCRKDTRRCVSW